MSPLEGWDSFKEDIRTRSTKKDSLKTVVIDTISGLYDLCRNSVCKANGCEYPPANDHGKVWNAVKREFMDTLSKLIHVTSSVGATLIMIDHSKIDMIETTTENIEKVSCAMPGQARNVILPIPDHIWFLGYAEKEPGDALKNTTSKRALFIGGGSTIEAGCRDPKVKTKVIVPLSQKDPYSQILEKLYGEKNE